MHGYFQLSGLTDRQHFLLSEGVHMLRSASYGGWQSDEYAMNDVLTFGVDHSGDGCTLPDLTSSQLNLLLRGVGALGTQQDWPPELTTLYKRICALLAGEPRQH